MVDVIKLLDEAAEAPLEVRYRLMREHLDEMDRRQFARAMQLVRVGEKALMLKERAAKGDKIAEISLDQWVNGDPNATIEEARLGLVGLWKIRGNESARDVLIVLGEEKAAEGEEAEIEAAQIPPAEMSYLQQQLEEERKKREELEKRLAEIEKLKGDLESGRGKS